MKLLQNIFLAFVLCASVGIVDAGNGRSSNNKHPKSVDLPIISAQRPTGTPSKPGRARSQRRQENRKAEKNARAEAKKRDQTPAAEPSSGIFSWFFGESTPPEPVATQTPAAPSTPPAVISQSTPVKNLRQRRGKGKKHPPAQSMPSVVRAPATTQPTTHSSLPDVSRPTTSTTEAAPSFLSRATASLSNLARATTSFFSEDYGYGETQEQSRVTESSFSEDATSSTPSSSNAASLDIPSDEEQPSSTKIDSAPAAIPLTPPSPHPENTDVAQGSDTDYDDNSSQSSESEDEDHDEQDSSNPASPERLDTPPLQTDATSSSTSPLSSSASVTNSMPATSESSSPLPNTSTPSTEDEILSDSTSTTAESSTPSDIPTTNVEITLPSSPARTLSPSSPDRSGSAPSSSLLDASNVSEPNNGAASENSEPQPDLASTLASPSSSPVRQTSTAESTPPRPATPAPVEDPAHSTEQPTPTPTEESQELESQEQLPPLTSESTLEDQPGSPTSPVDPTAELGDSADHQPDTGSGPAPLPEPQDPLIDQADKGTSTTKIFARIIAILGTTSAGVAFFTEFKRVYNDFCFRAAKCKETLSPQEAVGLTLRKMYAEFTQNPTDPKYAAFGVLLLLVIASLGINFIG